MACPAAVREKLVLDVQRQKLFLQSCREHSQISDALILNTCNRLEFYFCLVEDFDISAFIDNFISYNGWNEYKRTFHGIETTAHLFSVAAGVESQIIGENEIFSQLKSAYSFAIHCDTIGFMFHRLLHSAFRVAKAVRTHTDINTGALSIAQAAVELAADNSDVSKAKVSVIGSGANAELVIKHLIRKKAKDITIVARNKDSAERLIEKTTVGQFLPLNGLENHLPGADVVFAAAASQKPLVTAANLENRAKPLILIDLSVPPNIELNAANMKNIKLFNIDSLNEIIGANNRKRRTEIPKAKTLIAEHLQTFSRWHENLKVALR